MDVSHGACRMVDNETLCMIVPLPRSIMQIRAARGGPTASGNSSVRSRFGPKWLALPPFDCCSAWIASCQARRTQTPALAAVA